MDATWEFIGGKRKAGETVREAARRELDEELASDVPGAVAVVAVADPYPSGVGEEYVLHPVLVEFLRDVAAGHDGGDLSGEHDALAWIAPGEFDEYETLGQSQALEQLSIVE